MKSAKQRRPDEAEAQRERHAPAGRSRRGGLLGRRGFDLRKRRAHEPAVTSMPIHFSEMAFSVPSAFIAAKISLIFASHSGSPLSTEIQIGSWKIGVPTALNLPPEASIAAWR